MRYYWPKIKNMSPKNAKNLFSSKSRISAQNRIRPCARQVNRASRAHSLAHFLSQ